MDMPDAETKLCADQGVGVNDDDASPASASMEARQRWFTERYKDWIAEEHAAFETYGIWNEEFRPW